MENFENEFEEWARKVFKKAGMTPPEDESLWCSELEDLLDTDPGAQFYLEKIGG